MKYIGIDPGKTGAIAVINEDGTIFDIEMFRSFKDTYTFLTNAKAAYEVFAGIENIHAIPGGGSVSAFTFAKNCGGLEAVLQVTETPYILVSVQSWQPKILGKFPKGESKKAASAYIAYRYPELKLSKKEQGIADALCIALYVSKYK